MTIKQALGELQFQSWARAYSGSDNLVVTGDAVLTAVRDVKDGISLTATAGNGEFTLHLEKRAGLAKALLSGVGKTLAEVDQIDLPIERGPSE